MGINDKHIFEVHSKYILNVLFKNKCKKLAFLGAPEPYIVSEMIKELTNVNIDFFDISLNETNDFFLDLNSTGWGKKLNEKYDMLVILRTTMFIKNSNSFIKELQDFINSSQKFVIIDFWSPLLDKINDKIKIRSWESQTYNNYNNKSFFKYLSFIPLDVDAFEKHTCHTSLKEEQLFDFFNVTRRKIYDLDELTGKRTKDNNWFALYTLSQKTNENLKIELFKNAKKFDSINFNNSLLDFPRQSVKEFRNLTKDAAQFKKICKNLSTFTFEKNKTIDELKENGICLLKQVFKKEQLETINSFQTQVENILGPAMFHSGYIHADTTTINGYKTLINLRHKKIEPNFGQIRFQSKNLNEILPGFDEILANEQLLKIFSIFYNDYQFYFTRWTLEWIVPAPIIHAAWHIDIVRPELKAMILLNDVDENTAPMCYALKSHNILNKFELNVKHRLVCSGTTVNKNLKDLNGEHYLSFFDSHAGFLNDSEANNNIDECEQGSVILGEKQYKKFICTGKTGDVILFNSSGLHRGNRAKSGIRKNLVLSNPSAITHIGAFLNFIGRNDA